MNMRMRLPSSQRSSGFRNATGSASFIHPIDALIHLDIFRTVCLCLPGNILERVELLPETAGHEDIVDRHRADAAAVSVHAACVLASRVEPLLLFWNDSGLRRVDPDKQDPMQSVKWPH